MRRLPIFFLLDTSESMIGPNIQSLEAGMEEILATLRTDPHALETVHLSVIAFAGRAGVLAPLIDLVRFYPPRLPVGSGTNLPAGLECLIEQIDTQVQRRSATSRGDYKPVVYLMTDGRSTSNTDAIVAKWNAHYRKRVNLIAIAIGSLADTAVLSQLTDNVIRFDQREPGDFDKMIRWVTASISIQSQSVEGASSVSLAKVDGDLSFLDAAMANTILDDQLVVIPGKCQTTGNEYLLKYLSLDLEPNAPEEVRGKGLYLLQGCYAVDASYKKWSDASLAAPVIDSRRLIGGAACPHCPNQYAFALCNCTAVHCVAGDGLSTCPNCGTRAHYAKAKDDSPGQMVERGRG